MEIHRASPRQPEVILEQNLAILGTAADPVLAHFLHHSNQQPAAKPAVEEHNVERQFPSYSLPY